MTASASGARCPNGHASDESDYCSVCGAPMAGAAVSDAAPAAAPEQEETATPGGAGTCPSCGTPRSDPSARYCEVCRYDFELHVPGPPPTAAASTTQPAQAVPAAPAAPVAPPGEAAPGAGQAPPDPQAPPAEPAPTGPAEWEVTIVVDPSLDTEPDPAVPPPADLRQRLFPIDLPEMLVGRRDDAHHIRPEIPVYDPGASRRHANFLRLPGGGLGILDLASANGTAANGAGLVPGECRELHDGDTVTLGRWTRITVRRRRRPGA